MGTDLATQDAVASAESPEQAAPRIETRLAGVLLSLVPGATIVYFGFNAGGYFAGTTAFGALLVAQCLVVRLLLGERPFAGVTRTVAAAGATFAALAGWTLASGLWSHDQSRALIEFDRVYLYLLLFVLFGVVARDRARVRWIVRGLSLGAVVVCAAGLISRILPHVISAGPSIANNRLSYPVTYWNALGIVTAIGILVTLALTSDPHERWWVRTVAAAAIPPLAATLYFTFSRGGIAAVAIGACAYVVVARPRNVVGTLFATGPTAAVAVIVAYHADKLATTDPTTPAAVTQGHHVAVVVAVCALAAALLRLPLLALDHRLAALPTLTVSRGQKLGITGSVAAVVVVVALGAGFPGWVSHQYKIFIRGASTSTVDLRSRLLDPSSNGRTDHWRVARAGARQSLFHGNGAGTYEFTWNQRRHLDFPVADAHSLYLETLDELGIVGLILLVGVMLAALAAMLRRARGPNRVAWAGVFAAGVAFALHAGVDWDWEMPVTTAWFFAVGGAALAGAVGRVRARSTAVERARVPLAIAVLVSCVTPVLIIISQTHLQRSTAAFNAGNCTRATSEAISTINTLAPRPEPYEILGYCDLRNGQVTEALAAMRKAVSYEAANWQYHYDLALAQAASGTDPHAELQKAVQLSPREPLLIRTVPQFAGTSPARWERAAASAREDAVSSGTVILK